MVWPGCLLVGTDAFDASRTKWSGKHAVCREFRCFRQPARWLRGAFRISRSPPGLGTSDGLRSAGDVGFRLGSLQRG
jgi:hypothetical protein